MWKYVSRRIKDSVERSVNCFDKRFTTGITNHSSTNISNNNKESAPSCWSISGKCWNDFKADSKNSKKWNFEYINDTWLNAITWSSALVLGWYANQLIQLKYKYRCNNDKKKESYLTSTLCSLSPYVNCVNKNALYLESAPIVEKVLERFTPTVHLVSNDKVEGNCGGASSSSGSSLSTQDSSENDLGIVLNSIENKLGLAAIENGQHQDGLNLLRSAASRNYPPALYNLGLCYEQGLGVKPDEKMAMELYKSAAALEHSGAMFNLGIYYGQGRGGLVKDTDTATRLFRLAAMKGQKDALQALKYLNLENSEPSHKNEDAVTYIYKNYAQNDLVPTQSRLFVDNVNHNAVVF